jgi:hypothetical protein
MSTALQQAKDELRDRCPKPGTLWKSRCGHGLYTVAAPTIIVGGAGIYTPAVAYHVITNDPLNTWTMSLEGFLQQYEDVSAEAVTAHNAIVAEALARIGPDGRKYILQCNSCGEYVPTEEADMWCPCGGDWKQVPLARVDWRACTSCGVNWPHPPETSWMRCPACR